MRYEGSPEGGTEKARAPQGEKEARVGQAVVRWYVLVVPISHVAHKDQRSMSDLGGWLSIAAREGTTFTSDLGRVRVAELYRRATE
jgi:hypothetical protein